MIIPPRPWVSLSEGGYLVTPLKLLKRQVTRRAQQLLESADLSIVFSAVNAMQNTAFRINNPIYRNMRKAWDAGHLFFGLETHTVSKLPPSLPGDADSEQIHERKRERADAFNRNNRIKGLHKIMALRLSHAERLLDEPRFYFPYQLDYRGRAYPVPQHQPAVGRYRKVPARIRGRQAPWRAWSVLALDPHCEQLRKEQSIFRRPPGMGEPE
jgi:DNA-directed RNA polymerase